jgi:hypothetical protein
MNIPITTTHGKHETAVAIHRGRVVSVSANRITTSVEGVMHSHITAPDVKVRRGGRQCKLEELAIDDLVQISTRKDDTEFAVEIECIS